MSEYTTYKPNPANDEGRDALFSRRVPLAMAFVRDQDWEKPMAARDALSHGTAFRSLVKPFRGAEVRDEE